MTGTTGVQCNIAKAAGGIAKADRCDQNCELFV
jgi:hypothetical protein